MGRFLHRRMKPIYDTRAKISLLNTHYWCALQGLWRMYVSMHVYPNFLEKDA